MQPHALSYRLPLRGSTADRLLAIRIATPLAAVLHIMGRKAGRKGNGRAG
jgi:hypothetical protein